MAIGVLLAAICLQTRQESWSYPDAFAGALFLVSGVVFPLAVLPDSLQVLGLLNPVTWWVAGVRLAIVPDGPSSIGGEGSLWTAVTGTVGAGRRRRSSSPCSSPGRWLHSRRSRSSGRASAGPGIGACSTGRRGPRPPIRPASGARSRSEGAAMRIYEGSPRQDFEEVFRSIGAFLDSRGMRDILLLEVPDGFIVQGLVAGGASSSAWSESVGSLSKETLSFLDEDIAKFMEEARSAGASRRPRRPPAGRTRARSGSSATGSTSRSPRTCSCSSRTGRTSSGSHVGGPAGAAPRARGVHPRRRRRPRRRGPDAARQAASSPPGRGLRRAVTGRPAPPA